jgi:hypothetical protein
LGLFRRLLGLSRAGRQARLLPPDPERLRTGASIARGGLKMTPWPEV